MEPMIITNTLFSFLQISLILLQERLVLAVFYYATGGDQWSRSTNWLTATHHEDNWYGVTTDSSTDYVLELDLFSNALSGSIPTEIGSLTSLEYLFLSNNALSGSIPAQIGSLTSLQQLYLDFNALSGSIPTEIGSLTSLGYLGLGYNALSGSIPTEIGSLTSLQWLYLFNNDFSGSIPDGVCDVVQFTLQADCVNCNLSKEGCCNSCYL